MQNESMRLDRPDSRVEPKVMAGLQTFMGISEQGLTSFTCPKEGLLEFILSPANMNAAYKKVKSNRGSGGIDGMSTEALLAYLKKHGSEFIASLLEGTYKPNPVRRVISSGNLDTKLLPFTGILIFKGSNLKFQIPANEI